MSDPCTIDGDQALSDRVANGFAQRMQDLSERLLNKGLESGGLTLDQWHEKMQEAIKLAWLQQAIAGTADQDERELTSKDLARIQKNVDRQMKYLDNFASDIENAVADDNASLNFVPSRAALYAQSSSAEYWLQAIQIELPAVPCDGSTTCLSHCGCSWRLECEYDDNDQVTAVNAYWELDPALEDRHCLDCPQRAEDWNPLRIPINE